MKQMKVEAIDWCLKALLLCFCFLPFGGGFQSDHFPVFDGMAVFCRRGPKNIGFSWISPPLA